MGCNEEIFDVVDEQDQVIGQRPRNEVHERGLRHRATHMLVFNSRGELFLQQRSMTKDMWPGVWDSSAAGHLDAGEEYDACALRELGEELGFKPATPPTRWFRLGASPETGMEFCWVYRLHGEGPFQLQVSEVRGGGWFLPVTINSWLESRPEDFASAFRILWPMARERLASEG
jgi:isopentenyl-diphosphate delta-isomerase type 1